MQKKIALISFDNWNYDKNIIKALKNKNIEAVHINIGAYKHKNIFFKITNALSKIFLGKNPKHIKRQEFVINELKKLGKQDQILVINPELIDYEYHLEIKKHTQKYIAYLYDSVARFSVKHLLDGVFDEIFSFDAMDCQQYNFKKTTNYIYLDKTNDTPRLDYQYKVATVSSFDNRFSFFNNVANQLSKLNICFNFVFVSRNIFYKILKYRIKNTEKVNKNIIFQSKKISLENTIELYKNSFIILDLVQDNQTGLSFRVFEAMALQKKIITDNQAIREYDFYNPKNIMVINKENFELTSVFLNEPYEQISDEIYNRYTIQTWEENIFNL